MQCPLRRREKDLHEPCAHNIPFETAKGGEEATVEKNKGNISTSNTEKKHVMLTYTSLFLFMVGLDTGGSYVRVVLVHEKTSDDA